MCEQRCLVWTERPLHVCIEAAERCAQFNCQAQVWLVVRAQLVLLVTRDLTVQDCKFMANTLQVSNGRLARALISFKTNKYSVFYQRTWPLRPRSTFRSRVTSNTSCARTTSQQIFCNKFSCNKLSDCWTKSESSLGPLLVVNYLCKRKSACNSPLPFFFFFYCICQLSKLLRMLFLSYFSCVRPVRQHIYNVEFHTSSA